MLAAGGVLGGAAVLVRHRGGPGWGLLALLATGLVAAQLLLRTGGSPFTSAEAVEAELASGQPVLVEVYSDY